MRKAPLLICVILAALLLPSVVGLQTIVNKSEDISDIIRNSSSINIADDTLKHGLSAEIYLSMGVLAFGLILVLFTGILALRKSTGWDQEATRVFTLTLIVTAGLFLITAGYSDQQIAPMFGLLGTISGYLLGKSSSTEHIPKSGT